MPDVSIIIVCMNNLQNLYPCLQSIKKYTTKVSYETFVVAYLFTKENLAKLREDFPWVKIVESNEIRGFSENNNLAVRQAQGKYCFVLNDDTEMKMPVVDRLVETIENLPEDVAIVSPVLVGADGAVQVCGRPYCDWKINIKDYLHIENKKNIEKYCNKKGVFQTYNIIGAAFLIKTDVFKAMGWFDERFFFCPEDIALSDGLNKVGYKCFVNADVQIVHYEGMSGKSMSMTLAAIRPASAKGSVIFYSQGKKLLYTLLSLWYWIHSFCQFLFHRGKGLMKSRPNVDYVLSLGDMNVCKSIFTRHTPKEIFIKYYKGVNERRQERRQCKNIVTIDGICIGNHPLAVALSKYTNMEWRTFSAISNKRKTRWDNLYRYLLYFLVPLLLFLRRRKLANIVAWQQFYGILFAFYSHLFRVKKRTNLVILTFIYNKKKGLLGKLYKWLIAFAIESKYVDLIVCFSMDEIAWYKKQFPLIGEKIVYMPVAIQNDSKYDTHVDDKKYVFSAGYSCRDYDFLIESLNGTGYNVIIADNHIKTICEENIQVIEVENGEEVMSLMAKSYCVVIPLKDKLISAGQIVAIRAMQMGKPVICTDSAGMRPYIKNMENGILINNTKEDLHQALDLLYNDEALYKRMSAAAILSGENFTCDKLAYRISEKNKDLKFFK